MSAEEKLQKAIEATIAAGYQLNSEAFEFLIQNSQQRPRLDNELGFAEIRGTAGKTHVYRK